MNIALVDDSSSDRNLFASLLREYASIHRLDLDIESFASAEALLAAYHPLRYTAIFLDVYMEGMSGAEAAVGLPK